MHAPPVVSRLSGFSDKRRVVRLLLVFRCSALHSFDTIRATMASADFCRITPDIAARCAVMVLDVLCRFALLWPWWAATLARVDWGSAQPIGRLLRPAQPPRVWQTSPGKDAMFRCTSAAFTMPTKPMGFVVTCQLAPQAWPYMRFLFVASHVCTQASSRQVFAGLPLPSASGYNSHNMVAISVLPQGTSTPLHRAHAGRTHFVQA